ncbi:hypothetical protein [Pseudonocardia hydrocarbonoxydans]|uniref:DUF2637 domain-containing protein n=1 Tax=Pseudonocardia hydrocarbonoxydans TaxID=76726 RepID=A0A4Y3WVF0_9PSEU|nr:hypothetical protein [Pseudonocardia hydrocarbonoxydans]GEC22783.1 hypothetical protein PHY01_50660 [Pseudonocardia hydrocarbonoxydans]
MTSSGEPAARVIRAVIWLPGLAVALGAAVATAHGLYEVAHAARVPAGIAWLYPLITDGLALVAYAATARLSGSAARYAWSVVVLAAGLSGLAQAAFLASGSAVEASAALRFGVGAWPAIAAAIVAHLLYLLATDERPVPGNADDLAAGAVQPEPFNSASVQPNPPPVQEVTAHAVQPAPPSAVQRPSEVAAPAGHPALAPAAVEQQAVAPARERARAAAMRHAHRHGALPTVTELEAAAEVSRGTASAALKHLRAQPTPLHLIARSTDEPDPSEHEDDPTIERATQP